MMKQVTRSQIRFRFVRYLAVGIALACSLFFFSLNIVRLSVVSPHAGTNVLQITRVGFAEFVSLLFLAVGILVWMYAQDRRVARLLFGFCCFSMGTFAVQTAAAAGDLWPSVVGHIGSAFALLTLSRVLLSFPVQRRLSRGLGLYQVSLFLLVLPVILSATSPLFAFSLPTWVETLKYGYYIVAIIGIVWTVSLSYRQAETVRAQQQMRLLLAGITVAFAPLLIFTILPMALQVPTRFIVDSQLSAVSLGLFPLLLGYAVLRYQILAFDTFAQRAVQWLVGYLSLGFLCYLAFILSSILLRETRAVSTTSVGAIALVILIAPFLWFRMQSMTEQLFFPETVYYRRVLEQPNQSARETLDLQHASQVLALTVKTAFQVHEAYIFVLDDGFDAQAQSYQLEYPKAPEASSLHLLYTGLADMKRREDGGTGSAYTLDTSLPLITSLSSAARPLLLSEARQTTTPTRFFALSPSDDVPEPLLVPIRAQGKMIGVLLLGLRGDGQQYAGTDFKNIQRYVDRFSSTLETTRLYAQKDRQQLQQRLQQERVNGELLHAVEQQKALDVLKDQFMMTASHELRTPLTAVQGYIELLEQYNGTLTSEMRGQFIGKARRGCDELTLLLSNIMDASRLQVDRTEMKPERIVVQKSVEHVLTILDAMLAREERSLEVSIPPSLCIHADEIRVRQVLLNLFGNALKYSPPGTGIEVSAVRHERYVHVSVRDYGTGIPPDDQPRLFERFVRLERDMNSPVRGTGLGLYISRQLVEAMGGTIWVESTGQQGMGSTFTFTLPAAREDEQHKEITEHRLVS